LNGRDFFGQQIAMKLPTVARVKSVELLKGETTVPHRIEDQVLRFTVPAVSDYEVAAITIS
jgi:hypothetical protein